MDAAPLYLRCDLSPAIGVGHFKRLMTLSNHVKSARFVLPQSSCDMAASMGVEPADIVPIAEGAETDWMGDLPPKAWIITDICYAGNKARAEDEVAQLVESGARVCVIDSMPPDHFETPGSIAAGGPELVITPYANADVLRPPPEFGQWLTGGRFAVLDGSYETVDPSFPAHHSVLIATGGSDPTGLALRCADALSGFEGPVTVVAGPLFDSDLVDALQDWAQLSPLRNVALSPPTLAPLIANHSIVVGRPGLIRYEAASLGRTSVLLSETGSYETYFEAFAASGLAEIYFADRAGGQAAFFDRLASLDTGGNGIFDENLRAKAEVPLGGAARIVAALNQRTDPS